MNEPDDNLRAMPHNRDAERAILSCLLQWPDQSGPVWQSNEGEALFYLPAHRRIYNAIRSLHDEREAIDLITVTTRLRDSKRLEEIGGPATLAELASDVPSPMMLRDYLRLATDDAKRRAIITDCFRVATGAYDRNEKVEALIQDLDNTTQRVFRSISAPKTQKLQTVILDTVDIIEARMKGDQEIPGLSFGIPELDEATNGAGPGEMIIVGARPSLGKTSLALNFAAHFAKQGNPTAIFSAEMLSTQLGIRFLSSAAQIDSIRLAKGRIGKDEIQRLHNSIPRIASLPIWIDDRSDMRPVDIQVGLRTLVKEHGIKVGIIDYLQLLKEPEGSRNREDAVRKISNCLFNIAKELQISLVVLAQLNRDADGRIPRLSDLRDSGSIEQDAHKVFLIHADNPAPDAQIIDAEIIIAKGRDCRLGPVEVEFHRPFTTFKPKAKTQ